MTSRSIARKASKLLRSARSRVVRSVAGSDLAQPKSSAAIVEVGGGGYRRPGTLDPDSDK